MILLLCILLCSTALQAKILLLDKIDKIVCGPDANTPITHTDIGWKRSLTGEQIPVEKLVQMEIVRQQIIERKIPIDDTAAVQYLEKIKKANGITQSELIEMFGEVGLLYAEGKKQLVDQYTYDMFLQHQFRSQVLVTSDQVEEYHAKNPEIEPVQLEIKSATVSYDEDTKDSVAGKIKAFMDGDATALSVEWDEPVKIAQDQLSDEKLFLADLKQGEMTSVDNYTEFDIYCVVRRKESREKSLQERRAEITELLSRRQFEQLLKEYNVSLKDKIRVIEMG
jgi:hypothetical protein